jgi:hypothetical protein
MNKDVAFLHKPSKSIIEADLLFNLPCALTHSCVRVTSVNKVETLNPIIMPSLLIEEIRFTRCELLFSPNSDIQGGGLNDGSDAHVSEGP